MKKLHIGCGKDIKAGYVNLDLKKRPGVDVVHDLEQVPYPFPDETFEEVYGQHVLEHVQNLEPALRELLRITKKGGKINLIAPYFAGHGAFNDPTHKRFFTYLTLDYLAAELGFRIEHKKLRFFSAPFLASKGLGRIVDPFINLFPVIYQRFFCWILPASEIHYQLVKL